MKKSFTTEAINLKNYPLGDFDSIVVMFSKQKGLMRAVAKGVKKPKSKLGAQIQLFIANKLMLFEGKKLDTISQASAVNTFSKIRKDLDKLTTLVLFTLRTMYDEEKERNATSSVVYTTTASIMYKLLELKIVAKKPTMKDIVDSIRLLANQNILTKIEGSIDDSSCQLAILPTILLAVSNEKSI